VFDSLRGYRGQWLRADLIAGLTVWAVLVPEALAYATIAGVPPVVGLYAAVPALVLYAAVGSSRHLVVGPMSATAALSAAIVAPVAGGHGDRFVAITAALAIATGIVGLIGAAIRLGFVAQFISEPVLKGFIVGLALTIMIGQVPKLLGLHKAEGDFFAQAWGVLRHLGDAQWRTAVVGVASLAVVLVLRRWLPLVPGSLVAVVAGILAVHLLDLEHKGVAIVGHIDSGLPAVRWPDGVGFHDLLGLLGPGIGVLLIGFAEGLGAAKTYAAQVGYEISANRELAGLGAANLGAGLCSGMVVNGSLSKTAVNGGAGAKS
jgi:MFS superfamily sulfate permease-like transporter